MRRVRCGAGMAQLSVEVIPETGFLEETRFLLFLVARYFSGSGKLELAGQFL
jgi:hypothetical protein